MSVPAARVRTSSGWRDIAIQGPQGIAGRTPSAKAASTSTALTWAAADTNGRVYGPAITSTFDDFGTTSFANSRWNCLRTGRYLLIMSVDNYSVNGTSLIGIIVNGATVIKRVQGTLTRGADGSAPGQIAIVEANFNAGDYAQLWGWHSGGGTAGITWEAIQLDAPAVSVPSNSPAYLTAAQFAALTPIDGMEVYLIVDATNGVVWHLRYNASSSSAYKWEYLGGPPMNSQILTDETAVAAPYVDLATVGPSIVVPRAGDYDIDFHANVYNTSAAMSCYVAPKLGAAATVDTDSDTQGGSGFPATTGAAARRRIRRTLAANDTVKMQYGTNGGTAHFRWRDLAVQPVRIS